MKLSVIIPIGDMSGGLGMASRYSSLLFALESFYSKLKDTEVTIVAQNVSLELDQKYPNVRIISVNYPIFNKCWLINVGARQAASDYICVAESDMWADNPYLTDVPRWMKQYKCDWCFAWNRLFYTSLEEKNLIIATGLAPLERPHRIVKPQKGYSEGGFICFRKDFYWNLGGFNEWMEELGGMDNEMVRRAEYLTHGRHRYPMYPRTVHHLWHEKVKRSISESRRRNKGIYRYVCRSLPQSIALLRSKNWGNISEPYTTGDSFCVSRTKAGF